MKYSNRKTQNNSYSGYSGVYWNKKVNKWMLIINYNKEQKYIGNFRNIEDAIRIRKNVEHACDTFKNLKVNKIKVFRYKNTEYYLLAVIPDSNLPTSINVGITV